MRMRVFLAATMVALFVCAGAATVSAAEVDHPRKAAPSWFTDSFKQKVDAAGPEGIPLDDHSPLDVCPGVVVHEGGVGTGTCLVYPYGCTANFVYYKGRGTTAPAVSDGNVYLGSAGHCSDKAGEPVYGAVSTPGVGPSIARIGTVSKRKVDYPGDGKVYDFEAIKLEPGFQVHPESPVGGPQGIYDGCDPGQPLKYYGHGYEVAVSQGKPEAGVAAHWFDDGYGWAGPAFGGDSGSGVINAATNQAAGDLTAIAILYLPYAPGETIGSRITWILEFLGAGYHLVNADRTLARDTTSACGSADGTTSGGNGKGGNGKGGKDKGGNGKGGGGKPRA